MSAGRRYLVVGAGALGGFYGCRLQRAGMQVEYLLHSDYEHVQKHGWRVESKDGDFELPSAVVHARPVDIPPADVVLLGLKSTSNHLLKELLPGLVNKTGVVLVMQNGLGIEEEVAELVGPDRVIGVCCFLCSNKVGPGHIRHLDYGTIAIGEYTPTGRPGGITERLRSIAADFEKAGIPVMLADDLRLARWKKLIWNIPFNGLSVLLDVETNELVGDPDLKRLVRSIMDEIGALARADGRIIEEEFVAKMLRDTEAMIPYKTSMKVDYDGARPLELDAIFGAPIRVAGRLGTPMPMVESLYRELRFLDRRRRSENAPAG